MAMYLDEIIDQKQKRSLSKYVKSLFNKVSLENKLF